MNAQTLGSEIIRHLPDWSLDSREDMTHWVDLKHNATGATIGISINTYKKTASAVCQFPKRSNRSYSRKDDFVYNVTDLKDFEDRIGFNYAKDPKKIANDISKRLIEKGYVKFYTDCLNVVQAEIDAENEKKALTKQLADVVGLNVEQDAKQFDSWRSDFDIDFSCEVNYKNEIQIKLNELTKHEATIILTMIKLLNTEKKEAAHAKNEN
jgi:hypothetical protein